MGAFVFGGFCDSFGCIWTFQIANFLWILGSIVSIVLEYIYVLILGRVSKGLTIGLVTCLIPVYVYEIFPPNKRGEAISVFHISSSSGIIIMYFVGHLLEKYVSKIASFKVSWGIQGIPGFVILILTFMLPESPKWLASKARWLEAAKSLQRVRTHKRTKAERNDKLYVTNAYNSGSKIKYTTFAHLFTRNFKRTSTGILLHVFIQLTSINTMMYFFTYLCDLCGLIGDTKLIVVSIQYILLGLLTFIPLVALDRARRVDFLIYGISIMGFTYFGMFLTSMLYHENSNNDNSPFDWTLEREAASTMVALFLFLVSVYASSLATVSWLYVGELFQDEERTKGTSVCMCVGFVIHGVTTLLLPLSFEVIRYWVFAVLSLLCIAGGIVFIWFPETKEISDVDSILLLSSDLQVEMTTLNSENTNGEVLESGEKVNSTDDVISNMKEPNTTVVQSETSNEQVLKADRSLKESNSTTTTKISPPKDPRLHRLDIFRLSSPDIDSRLSSNAFPSDSPSSASVPESLGLSGSVTEVIDAYSPFAESKSVHLTVASTNASLSDGSYFSDDWNSNGNHKSKYQPERHPKSSGDQHLTIPLNQGLATFSVESEPQKFSTKQFPGQQPLILDKKIQATRYIPFEGLRVGKHSPSRPIKKSKNKLHSS